jgi:processing peptidase subunit alpha
VQVNGRKVTVEEMCEKIDRVDLDNLCRVARRVFRPQEATTRLNFGLGSGQSTVVGWGNTKGLGDVRATLAKRGLGAPPTLASKL